MSKISLLCIVASLILACSIHFALALNGEIMPNGIVIDSPRYIEIIDENFVGPLPAPKTEQFYIPFKFPIYFNEKGLELIDVFVDDSGRIVVQDGVLDYD